MKDVVLPTPASPVNIHQASSLFMKWKTRVVVIHVG